MDSDVQFSFEDWDDLSDTPLMHLSYIIQALLPVRLVGWKNVRRHYDSLVAVNQRLSSDTYIITGSNAEGYAIPYSLTRTTPPVIEKPSDVDMLWVPAGIKISTVKLPEPNDTDFKGYLDYEGVPTGYARVCLPTVREKDESFIFDEETGKYYLSGTTMMEKLQVIIPNFKLQDSEKAFIQGPAFTIEDSQTVTPDRLHEPDVGASKDFVTALPCSPWPEIAGNWKSRISTSKWLDPELVNSIIEDGCHVVAVPSKTTLTPEREWRMSFSASEGRLAREGVTDHQRQCNIYLKILRKQVMGPESKLSSYVFKSVFLYCCEKLPVEYWRDYPGNCVLYVLDVLLECLGRKHVPTFFLPGNNLVGHLSESELDAAIASVVAIRCDPVTPILDYTDTRVIGYQSVIATFRDVMKPLLEDMKLFKVHRDKNISIMNGIIATGYNICHYLLHEIPSQEEAKVAKHQEAINSLIDIYTLWLRPQGLDATMIQFLNSAGLAIKDLATTCRFFEAMDSMSTEYPDFASVRGNLACLYHSLAYNEPDGSDKRSEYINKAGQLFEEVYEENESCTVDYVTFLVKQKRNKDALRTLNQFIANLDRRTVTSTTYTEKEQVTLEDPLRSHVQHHGKLEADHVSFAYFYIIKCHLELQKCDEESPDIKIAIQEFEKHCETIKTEQAAVLLSYAKSLSKVKENSLKPTQIKNFYCKII